MEVVSGIREQVIGSLINVVGGGTDLVANGFISYVHFTLIKRPVMANRLLFTHYLNK
jgi:hypothetical protein